MATEPAFGREFIIGNLQEIVYSIEKYLLEEPRGLIRKEVLPFLCVLNPPRHGKSLLLDTVFINQPDVIVLSITYNTGNLQQIA